MLGTEQRHDAAAAVVPSPGLNMEHGFLRKIEENQIQRHYQFKEDVMKRTETAKLARRVGLPNKSSKPTIEIYRPPVDECQQPTWKHQRKRLGTLESLGFVVYNERLSFTTCGSFRTQKLLINTPSSEIVALSSISVSSFGFLADFNERTELTK
ncbi:hypothetical protein MTO96_025197 [Rhipicephalus appendiculatus]